MVAHKDVVLAVLGAASGVGALVLVVLGFLVTTLSSYESDTSSSVTRSLKIVGTGVSGAFLCGALSAGMCLWWLVGGQPQGPYGWSIGLFVAQLALLLVAAGWVLVALIWMAP